MKHEPTNISSRIAWCRLQQQLHSVTKDERAGWRAEEAGLVDALFGKDRTALMRAEHRSQFTRYQCGIEDGLALLRLQQINPRWHNTHGGVGSGPLATKAWVDRRPSQAPLPVQVEARR